MPLPDAPKQERDHETNHRRRAALSVLRLLRKLGSFEIELQQVVGSRQLDMLTFVGLPRLAAALEKLPVAREIHLHIDQLRYIDHACLVAIGDFERQARQRGLTVVVDWTDLDARSEKRVPAEVSSAAAA
jgi:MFS superfamily sulfate permease-like transporter